MILAPLGANSCVAIITHVVSCDVRVLEEAGDDIVSHVISGSVLVHVYTMLVPCLYEGKPARDRSF